MRILVVNAGSTSIKSRIVEGAESTPVDLPPGGVGRWGESVDAVGHRVVHGGALYRSPVLVDDAVVRELRSLADLAPLHQGPALDALDEVRRLLPEVPAVACFDTAFHATIPPEASTYAIPKAWRDLGARRYGFHGLSHAWASRRSAVLAGLDPGVARVVTCHLGGGASLAAVRGGTCVDTTMGLTPLDGLVMATRPGSLDPGLLLWLQQRHGLTAQEISDALERRSGLVALSGSADMAVVAREAAAGVPAAALAFTVYVHRLRGAIGAMAAALGGMDALTFTGGVGEHSPDVRIATAEGLDFMGVAIDPVRNALAAPADRTISPAGSAVHVSVVESREDLEIAAGVRTVLAGPGA